MPIASSYWQGLSSARFAELRRLHPRKDPANRVGDLAHAEEQGQKTKVGNWKANRPPSVTIAALIITNTILGVPYYHHGITGPKTENPILIIKVPMLHNRDLARRPRSILESDSPTIECAVAVCAALYIWGRFDGDSFWPLQAIRAGSVFPSVLTNLVHPCCVVRAVRVET